MGNNVLLVGTEQRHLFWEAGHLEVVEILLEYGGDPLAKNSQGNSPIDVAKTPEIRQKIKQALAAMGKSNYSPLFSLFLAVCLQREREKWSSQVLPLLVVVVPFHHYIDDRLQT